jgi:hypothetical protein
MGLLVLRVAVCGHLTTSLSHTSIRGHFLSEKLPMMCVPGM